MRKIVSLLALLATLATPVAAQLRPDAPPPATLVSDRVEITRDRRLVATGKVEVFYDGRRLRATRVTYDRAGDRLTIEGPILLTDDGGTVIVADSAILDADLRNGIVQSARVVLDRQLQIAANEVVRADGRYTRLSRAVASSCKVCSTGETPLWEIRARSVVHDEVERQIYFTSAQLRMAGIPVLWLPSMRMPDPSLTRATGFLAPRLFSTTALGTGIEVPYFFRLGDSRDLTVTPLIGTNSVAALSLRYRQAFRTGTLTLTATAATDPLVATLRGRVAAVGDFALPRDFALRFDLEAVSDRTYLSDYGISSKDRITSRAEVLRVRRDEVIGTRLISFSSLRAGEDNATLPALAADAGYRRRFDLPGIGGRFDVSLLAHAHYRTSAADMIGRDVARTALRADWQRSFVLPAGILATLRAELAGDLVQVTQDSAYPALIARLTPAAAVELRWPLVRGVPGAARDVLEPVAQIVWSAAEPAGVVPNEDSTHVELDEGNLFAFSRFPGADRREGGTRINLGLGWTRFTPGGWTFGGLAGRIIRLDDPGQFTAASGLRGPASNWLLAAQATDARGFAVQGRALFDDAFSFARSEVRLAVNKARYGVGSSYIWAVADIAENRPIATSEAAFDGRYRLSDMWTAKAAGRYDFVADRATAAAVGLEFANECLRVDLSLSRSFTSSSSVADTTNFGVKIDFLGFGSGRAETPVGRTCRN